MEPSRARGGAAAGRLLEHTRSIEEAQCVPARAAAQGDATPQALQQEALMHMRRAAGLGHLPAAALPTPACRGRPARPTRPHGRAQNGASFSVKNQRTPRPSELKITPLPPHAAPPRSVDSLRGSGGSPQSGSHPDAVLRVSGRRRRPRAQEYERKDGAKEEGGSSGASGHGEAQPPPSVAGGPTTPGLEVTHRAAGTQRVSRQLPSNPVCRLLLLGANLMKSPSQI